MRKYNTQIAVLPKKLEAAGMILRRNIITETGDPNAAVNENIIRAKRKLMQMRTFLRSSSLSIPIKAKLVKLFMDPTTTYGLSTIALRIKDNHHLIALQNAERRMIPGMQSGKDKRVSELKEEIPVNNIASKPQQRRFSLWRNVNNQTPKTLIVASQGSGISIRASVKA